MFCPLVGLHNKRMVDKNNKRKSVDGELDPDAAVDPHTDTAEPKTDEEDDEWIDGAVKDPDEDF